MSSVFLAVKHDFCSLDLLSWVLHNHIRNPFKMSRAWRIFFSLYTCPTVLPSVKRNCYLLSESNCVYFRHSHVFKADRSNLWGKVSHFSKVRGLPLKLLFHSFLSGFQKYWFRYYGSGGKEGSKTLTSQMTGWGLHNTSVFWVELKQRSFMKPFSYFVMRTSRREKASVCLKLCLADMLSGGPPREFT